MPSERARLVPQTRFHTRDNYGSIRDAFKRRDVDASREAHKRERMQRAAGTSHHQEEHGRYSDYLRSAVYGGMDGIITLLAIIACSAGAGSSYQTVLIIGIAVQIADAFAMGFGDYVSTTAEWEHAVLERDRELWEVENCFDLEVQEMVEVYMKRGLSEDDSTRIVQIMSKNPLTFVEFMMADELGILIDIGDVYRPIKQGLLTFASFLVFSFVPLVVFVGLGRSDYSSSAVLSACAMATAIALGFLGGLKGYLMDTGMLQTGLAMMLNGFIACTLSYTVSVVLSSFLGLEPDM